VRRDLSIIYVLLPMIAAGFAALAHYSPENYLQAGALAVAAALAALAYLFPATVLGLVILSVGMSPERLLAPLMSISDARTYHRILVLLVVGVNILRHGWVWRSNPPMAALLVIFLASLVAADILPALDWFQMIKSLISLILPFLFLQCVYRREAIDRYIKIITFVPLISVCVGLLLAAAGVQPAFRGEYTGALRLQGMNIAPYLAQFAYAAFFLCVVQAVAEGQRGYFVLAGINLIIILATGTRMPMLTAAIMGVGVMLFSPQQSFSMSMRVKVTLAGLVLLAGALFVVWPQIEARFFGDRAPGASGRDVIWGFYMNAISENPWFGRGVGSGTVLLQTVDERNVTTTAAHNEYVRIAMDGGIFGLAIFLAAIVWWVSSERRFMRRDERVLFLSYMVSLAVLTFTENTLSSPTTMLLFFALAFFIQRARQRAVQRAGTPVIAAPAPRAPPPQSLRAA
jgi:O-antigen ligase